MKRTALLWMTHVWSEEIRGEFEKFLAIRSAGSPEVWLLADASISQKFNLQKTYSRCFEFGKDILFRNLPYRRLEGEGLYHNTHLPLMGFFLAHPGFDEYWCIEFDVRYTGDWGSFLSQFNPSDDDMITSHIRSFSEEPEWYWWNTLHHPQKEIPREEYIRAFSVIFRISGRALAYLHGQMTEGWRGHPEVLFPTLLNHGGFSIRDFGGKGKYVSEGMTNRNYTSSGGKIGFLSPFGSLHWRPSSTRPGLWKNRLYHPVKPAYMTESWKERLWYYRIWIQQRFLS